MGASLSFIFLIYTNESIFQTFLIAALMFGIMGIVGYTTKTDLTKMGNILFMALIGIIIGSLVNLFMKSDSLSYVISIIGVILFCGLTAWDIQKLKKLEEETRYELETRSKLGIFGALTLYLDFINLFLSLLRFTGNRKRN
jgi:FtsH-binding integral membrane protein